VQTADPKDVKSSSGPTVVSLTIYQDQNLALVQERRALELASGTATYQIRGVSARLLPDSVRLEAPDASAAIELLDQRFENNPLSTEELLKAHIGKEIEIYAPEGRGAMYRGRLISTQGGVILQEDSGRIQVVQDATRFRFPPQEWKGAMLLWTLKSDRAALEPIRLRYLSEGLNWRAHYTAILDSSEIALELDSGVSVSNESGVDYEQAQLNLVAGQIHRVEGGPLGPLLAAAEAFAKERAPSFTEQPSFEYHLYSLTRPALIPDGETVQLPFLQAQAVPIEKKYIYEGQIQSGVQVWVEFNNSAPLGTPLPAGIVRFYQRTLQGVQFLGEDRLAHTPIGERVKLTVGTAFDLLAQRIQTSHAQLGERTFRDSFQITLTNRKSEDVVIYARERLPGDWKVTASDPAFTKLDAQTIEFRAPVPQGSKAIVAYTVEYTLPY